MGSPTGVRNYCSPEAPILASSDIHSPRYLGLFKEALEKYSGPPPCLFLLAGDIVDKGNVAAAELVFKAIYEKFSDNSPSIVAVFGNEEYHDKEVLFIKNYNYITWLNDSYTIIECRGTRIGIVGTRGALERPTRWQRKNMPWLWRVYRERPRVIKELIKLVKKESDIVILLSHYALSKATIIGEPKSAWPEIYSPEMEKALIESRPNAAVHGHSHHGKPFALVNGIPVYNVALPLNKRLVKVCPVRTRTLLDFY